MRFIGFALSLWLLGIASAAAFDCSNISLPSSTVICSDPELQQLADERQAAINAARGRIGEDRWPTLWENQKEWVRSYATACGVPPDTPPPVPVPASVKECFKRAARERFAFIESYGLGSPPLNAGVAPSAHPQPMQSQPVASRIGPSFDCSKAKQPLALLLCADPSLARLDLRFAEAYYALYQQLGPTGQPDLRQEDLNFLAQVQVQCSLSHSGGLTPQAWQARECVKGMYERKREDWVSRLSGPAYQEATRQPEAMIALQRDLQQLGLAPGSIIDGVYGPVMRNAIASWQSARGLPVTGFISDADAQALQQQASLGLAQPSEAPRMQPAVQSPGLAENAIQMQLINGIYRIPVRINGVITLPFTVDTGASDVLVTADVAMTLARAGTIADDDFIGEQPYTLADGSMIKSQQFVLRELAVGDRVIRGVRASIGDVKGGLLLGQSFLSQFRTWTLDNERHALLLGPPRPGANVR